MTMKNPLPPNIQMIELPRRTIKQNAYRIFYINMLIAIICSLLSIASFMWLYWLLSIKLLITFLYLSLVGWFFAGVFEEEKKQEQP